MSGSYYHPFQKLCYISKAGDTGILIAAAGPYILSLDLKDGGVLSKWPTETFKSNQAETRVLSGDGTLYSRSGHHRHSGKRHKISLSKENGQEEQMSGESSISVEFVSERVKGQRRKKKKGAQCTLPNVSHITCTNSGCHVISVTAEDKCIRVFKLEPSGHLNLLSERQWNFMFVTLRRAYYCAGVCQRESVL